MFRAAINRDYESSFSLHLTTHDAIETRVTLSRERRARVQHESDSRLETLITRWLKSLDTILHIWRIGKKWRREVRAMCVTASDYCIKMNTYQKIARGLEISNMIIRWLYIDKKWFIKLLQRIKICKRQRFKLRCEESRLNNGSSTARTWI